jgi:hypothetical protein
MNRRKLNTSKVFISIMLFIGLTAYLVSCTNDNQFVKTNPIVPINKVTDLLSVKTTTAPTIDGVVEAFWDNCPKLEFSTEVPEVTGDVFRGYVGNIIPRVTLRSAYDANNIYFLAEWDDPTKSIARAPWYFNPTTKLWAQEKGSYDFDPATNGGKTRQPFYEDKISMLWNIDNSVNGWNSATCYKSCHTGLPAGDGSSRHYTNFSSEKIDMWHWKSVRGGLNGGLQFDDQYQDNTYPNGRKGDDGVGAYTNNSQKLKITGTATEVSVPKYIIPGRQNEFWLMESDFASGGVAKLVTAVDANGILTLEGGTTINPNTDTEYQRDGDFVGKKAVPGIYIKDSGYGGSKGDISCTAKYTGSGWIMEFTRALTTSDKVNDVDFSSLADQYFGFAVFENAQIAHSIKPNLLLKFEK